jgi:hypothetical protein
MSVRAVVYRAPAPALSAWLPRRPMYCCLMLSASGTFAGEQYSRWTDRMALHTLQPTPASMVMPTLRQHHGARHPPAHAPIHLHSPTPPPPARSVGPNQGPATTPAPAPPPTACPAPAPQAPTCELHRDGRLKGLCKGDVLAQVLLADQLPVFVARLPLCRRAGRAHVVVLLVCCLACCGLVHRQHVLR